MKILIIGSGGREHAIAWKLSQNKKIKHIYVTPGNAGIDLLEKGESIKIKDTDEILKFALEEKIDLTLVGSEELLVAGIVDKFKEKNLKIFGPDKKAAMLEGSKVYSKKFMNKYGVKTAEYEVFTDSIKALEYLEKIEFPVVVKASGLAAGKGVIIAQNKEEAKTAVREIMIDKKFSHAGDEVVIEEFLEGYEASILSFTDSRVILPMLAAKDHKKIYENETGLNTGGMGVISPNPYVTEEVLEEFQKKILEPTLDGIKKEEMDFEGVIFFGIMITKKGVYLLEYNMRMGDPETQAILPLLKSDLLDIIESCFEKELYNQKLVWEEKYSCCIVASSSGYPEKYKTGIEVTFDENINLVFFAGIEKLENRFLTAGGRVLNVIGTGESLELAREKAYENIMKIHFDGMYYRKDIGKI
ncbi:MAG: phosphoribosylamine--glycine ligase [Sebaldella sp.]|mgnify:CR=1 FL=1|nr:phosphoribosylamine--glycine ligase [Sebaldella sp.]